MFESRHKYMHSEYSTLVTCTDTSVTDMKQLTAINMAINVNNNGDI